MNIRSIEDLLARRSRGAGEQTEKGGNASWEQLFRIRHRGTNELMAASFDSSVPTGGAGASRGPVRFYFTGSKTDEADLETLWAIRPVNPKEDEGVAIGANEGFHLQHAATGYWVHAKTLEGGSDAEYLDSPREAERAVELSAERPYEDAFGVYVDEQSRMGEVVDLNRMLEIKPVLESFLTDLLPKRLANRSRDQQNCVTAKDVGPVRRLLTDSILYFITVEDSQLDPLMVRESTTAFPCASAVILSKTDAFPCGAAAGERRPQ